MKAHCPALLAVIAALILASPASAQQAKAVSVVAVCTNGIGGCGGPSDFDATRPQDFKLIQTYEACVRRSSDSTATDLAVRCAAKTGIRFLNSTDYHGPLVSIDGNGPPSPQRMSAQPSDPAFASTSISQSGASAPVAILGGTPIEIALLEELSSSTAQVGERLRFRAINSITSDGWVLVEKGALGEAEVVNAEGASGNGHPGKLNIQFDWIYGADGLKIRLSDMPTTSNGEAQQGGASTATIASYLILGPIGLFAHNFVRGRDIVIEPTQSLQVYVDQTVHITPVTRLTDADGFAH